MDGYFHKLLPWCKIKEELIKIPPLGGKVFWVDDGARTHDPQNHNLML